MSAEAPLSASSSDVRPTYVRIGVAAVLTLMSCLLYLDRFAVGIASEYIREDLRMTQTQMSWFLSAFFWSYALSQVPAGWLSDRFGPRRMLTVYILAWSAFTGLLGLAASVWLVLHLRLYCGAAQAGAFPVCGGLIRAWFPISQRGTASSIIALGGRAGGALAPILTAWLIVAFVSGHPVHALKDAIHEPDKFIVAIDDANQSTQPSGRLLRRLYGVLSQETKNTISTSASFHRNFSAARHAYLESTPKTVFEWRDWVPQQFVTIVEADDLIHGMHWEKAFHEIVEKAESVDLVDDETANAMKLPAKAQQLLAKRRSGTELSPEERRLLNRMAFEAAAPKAVRKHLGHGWRPTLILYGIVGLVVALAFAWVGRNSPKQHPWCNEAERNLIDDEMTRMAKAVEPRDAPFPWKAVLTSLSLWGNSLMQVFTNIGWLFVVTWLPRYLDKVHGVPLAEQALMTAVPTAAGIVGMFFGGRWTDLAARRAGLKWGRRLPVFSTRLLAAFGYGICLVLGMTCTPDPTTRWLPWAIVMGLSVMVMGCDLGIPAVWAYAQDVGGKYTASILGWANMWGNLGAAAAPLIYNAVLGETPSLAQWNMLFAVCGIAFILSGLCGLVLDATKPITAGNA